MSSAKCQPGCACKKHTKPRLIDWDSPEAVREHGRDRARERRAADPEPSREATRKWAAKNPGYQLAYKFGLTVERWEQMITEQDGLCYLCGEPLDMSKPAKDGHGGYRGIHVDHDHSCCRGAKSCGTCIRGIACFDCNVGIAKFGDDPERMRRVADNLEMANRRLREIAPITSAAPTGVSGEGIAT